MNARIVPFSEITSCPAHRLDATHYLPVHRTWECLQGSKLRTKQGLVNAFLKGKITLEQFEEAKKVVK